MDESAEKSVSADLSFPLGRRPGRPPGSKKVSLAAPKPAELQESLKARKLADLLLTATTAAAKGELSVTSAGYESLLTDLVSCGLGETEARQHLMIIATAVTPINVTPEARANSSDTGLLDPGDLTPAQREKVRNVAETATTLAVPNSALDRMEKRSREVFKSQKQIEITLPWSDEDERRLRAGLAEKPKTKMVCVNGVHVFVTRGVPIVLPEVFIEVLVEQGELAPSTLPSDNAYRAWKLQDMRREREEAMRRDAERQNKLASLGLSTMPV